MEIIGYARVSTREQNLDLQLDALKEAGCKLIFEEKVSGVKDRPELDKALAYLREGDTFVIWKLDRLGRSLKDLVYIVDCLQKRKIAFKSIVDGIDTNSALGRCQFGIFASLAEYEREIIVERTRAGLQAAKERGKLTGRPIGLSEDAKRKAIAAKRLYENDKFNYGREELVAELISALSGVYLGISVTVREENAAYLKSWCKAIKEEPKFLFTVLADAIKGSKFIAQHLNIRLDVEEVEEEKNTKVA